MCTVEWKNNKVYLMK